MESSAEPLHTQTAAVRYRPVEAGFNGKVTIHVAEGVDRIFAQIISDEVLAELSMVKEILNVLFSQTKAPETAPAVGTCVAAIYAEDGGFYRARVTAVDGNQLTLEYIDFGFTGQVELSQIRALTKEICDIPCSTYRFRLNLTCRPDFLSDDVKTQLSSLVGQIYSINVIKSDVGFIEGSLTKDGQVINNTIAEMIKHRSAESPTKPAGADVASHEERKRLILKAFGNNLSPVMMGLLDQEYSVNASASLLQEDEDNEDLPPQKRYRTGSQSKMESAAHTKPADSEVNYRPLIAGFSGKVAIHVAEGVDRIYGRIVCAEALVDLKNVEEALNALFAKTKAPETVPAVGSYVAAIFTEDDKFYRARVTAVDGNQLTLEYIDFGFTGQVELSQIRALSAELCDIPCSTYRLSLSLPRYPDGALSDIVKTELNNLVGQIWTILVLKYTDGHIEGTLTNNGQDINRIISKIIGESLTVDAFKTTLGHDFCNGTPKSLIVSSFEYTCLLRSMGFKEPELSESMESHNQVIAQMEEDAIQLASK